MDAIIHALAITGSMTWQIAWALILGFALSAVVQALVSKSVIVRLLGDDRPRTLAVLVLVFYAVREGWEISRPNCT